MRDRRRIILGVEAGKAYTSKEIKEKGFKPVIKVRETFRIGVKDELELYKIRGRIESIFGNIKQALGSYEKTTKERLARIYAISKFAIYNVYVLFAPI